MLQLTNSVKTAFRGYLRDRLYTSLNLFSLIIGLVVAYTAISYVRFELSYDRFHTNAGSVYRLIRTYRSQDYSVIGFANWDAATNRAQQQQLDALKKATGVVNAAQFIVAHESVFVEANGRKIQAKNLLTTNTPQAFCGLFTWELKQGSFGNFADGTNKLILTVGTARKLFGDLAADDPGLIQKRVKIGADYFTVAAIIADVPLHSHVDFSMAVSKSRLPYWGSRVYVQTQEGVDKEWVTGNINTAIATFNPTLAADPLYKQHRLQLITDIHLAADSLYELKPPGNALYLFLIGGFAVFIIIITLFNYANLSLAIKSKQSKAIGVRKVLGATDAAIGMQFVLEGVLLALLALPVAVGMLVLGLPAFNALMGVDIPTNVLPDPSSLLILLLLALLIGVLSSSATALTLARKKALFLFSNRLRTNRHSHLSVRKYLVVSQFVLLLLIASVSYFITKQVDFIENKDLGFQREGILYAYSSPEKQTVFQQKLRQIPGVQAVGNGSSFGIMPFNQMTYKLQDDATVFDDARQLYLDPEALRLYNLRVTPTTGRGTELPATYTLINRTAAEQLAARQQLTAEQLIGKVIITEPEYVAENRQAGFPFVVAGIVEDINVFSLHKKVEPYFITIAANLRMDGRSIIRYNPATTARTLAQIRAAHASLNESNPLEIEFLDTNITALYQQDRRMATLLGWFNLIACVLAAAGIVGITVFLTIARTKEIGIRKVLGASAFSIIGSATREYVFLVGLALLISWPIAVYVLDRWLQNFAYHIDLQQLVFVLIGFIALLLTTLIVAIVVYQAALMNPVTSLRSE